MFGIRRRLNNKRVFKEIEGVREEEKSLRQSREDNEITLKEFLEKQIVLGAKIKSLEKELR